MANITNLSFFSLKILILLIVLLNSFCCSLPMHDDESHTKRNIKARVGTHWNRIGKRFEEFDHPQQMLESHESKPKAEFFTKNEICGEFLDMKHSFINNEIEMRLQKFISIFILYKVMFLIFHLILGFFILHRSE